jgi:hypothetical protein
MDIMDIYIHRMDNDLMDIMINQLIMKYNGYIYIHVIHIYI